MNKLVLIALLVLVTAIVPYAFWVGGAIGIVWTYFGFLAVKIIEESDDEQMPAPAVGLTVFVGFLGFFIVAIVSAISGDPSFMRVLRREIPIIDQVKFQSPIVFIKDE